MHEDIPYGITKVQALLVTDDHVSNRKVCVVDTGYDIHHPDLPGGDQVTGYTGTYTAELWYEDGYGHGTHCAGTIAAIGGNRQGVVGIVRSGAMKMHIVRVFDSDANWAWTSDLISAVSVSSFYQSKNALIPFCEMTISLFIFCSMHFKVEQCILAEANVVSMSLGGGGFSQTAEDAYKRMLNEENVLLVAAAGNDGDSGYSYPASYDSVMSVAAVDSNENIAYFSQFNDQVDIAAPGVGVKSTYPGESYAYMSGTSMATAHVSGVAALVWSLNTTKSAKEVWSALTQSAKDKGAQGRDDYYGHGIVQAAAAALLLADDNFTLSPTASPTVPPPCIDYPEGWYDSDGELYDCIWYLEGSRCDYYGAGSRNFGKTANEACCTCGGGSIVQPQTSSLVPSRTPSKLASSKPSAEPSSSPSEVCTDSPEDWFDANGTAFDCTWYGSGEPGERCSLFGNNYENFGKTANQACCVCGGGDDSSPSSPPTNSPVSSPTPSASSRPSKLKSDAPSMWPSKPPSVSPSSLPTPTL